MKKIIYTVVSLLIISHSIKAQNAGDKILGDWLTADKSGTISIYKTAEKYFGKIIAGNGSSTKDDKNPEVKLRSRNLIGLVILSNFKFNGDSKWEDGEIYDPKSGKTYSCVMKMKNSDVLEVKGYVGITLFGRTETWTRKKK